MRVVPATQEAEAGESLEPGRWRLQWPDIVPLHSSLSDRNSVSKKKKVSSTIRKIKHTWLGIEHPSEDLICGSDTDQLCELRWLPGVCVSMDKVKGKPLPARNVLWCYRRWHLGSWGSQTAFFLIFFTFYFYLIIFKNGVSPCWLGWSWTPDLRWSAHLGLQSAWITGVSHRARQHSFLLIKTFL